MKQNYVFLTIFLVLTTILGISSLTFANLNTGLVAHFAFDGDADDKSGNGNHGITHGATLTSDRYNRENSAYFFDGENDYVEVPNIFNSTDLTIGAWIYINDYKSYGGIIDGYKEQWELLLNKGDGNKISFLRWNEEKSYNEYTTSKLITAKEWHHIVATINGTSGTFYIDGAADSNFTLLNLIHDSLTSLNIGVSLSGQNQQYFNGNIDDVYIYNRALTEFEVKDLYNQYSETGDNLKFDNETIFFKTGEKVQIKCNAEPNEKIWVFIEIPSLFPGLVFTRPSDEYCLNSKRYLHLFSVNNINSENLNELYFSASYNSNIIDFGMNDFTGLGRLVITVKKGNSLTNLQTLQVLTIVEEPANNQDNDVYVNGEPIVKENVAILSASTMAHLISQSDSGDQLIFHREASEIADLKENDVIISGEGDGLLKKVNSIQITANKITVYVEDALITDVFEKCSFRISHALTDEYIEEISIADDLTSDDVTVNSAVIPRLGGKFSLNQSIELNLKLDSLGLHRINGSFNAEYTFEFELEIDNSTVTHFMTALSTKKESNLNYTPGVKGSFDFEKEILSYKFRHQMFMVGPVPVIYQPFIDMIVGVESEINSGLTVPLFGINGTSTDKFGFELRNGSWSTFKTCNNEKGGEGIKDEIMLNASAKVYGGPKFGLRFWGLLGVGIEASIYGKGDVDLQKTLNDEPWWEVRAGFNAKGNINLKLWKIKDLLDLDLNLLDINFLIAQSPIDEITAPQDGSYFKYGDTITFSTNTGICNIKEAESLVWSSSIDGVFGNGLTCSTNTLSHGIHEINLSAIHPLDSSQELYKGIQITIEDSSQEINACFVATPISGSAPLVVDLDASCSSPSNTIVNYSWSSSDGQTTSGATASMTFTSTGTYTILLTVTDQKGHTGTAQQDIIVENEDEQPSTEPWIKLTCDGKDYCSIPYGGSATLEIEYFAPNNDAGKLSIYGAHMNQIQVVENIPDGLRSKGIYKYFIANEQLLGWPCKTTEHAHLAVNLDNVNGGYLATSSLSGLTLLGNTPSGYACFYYIRSVP